MSLLYLRRKCDKRIASIDNPLTCPVSRDDRLVGLLQTPRVFCVCIVSPSYPTVAGFTYIYTNYSLPVIAVALPLSILRIAHGEYSGTDLLFGPCHSFTRSIRHRLGITAFVGRHLAAAWDSSKSSLSTVS